MNQKWNKKQTWNKRNFNLHLSKNYYNQILFYKSRWDKTRTPSYNLLRQMNTDIIDVITLPQRILYFFPRIALPQQVVPIEALSLKKLESDGHMPIWGCKQRETQARNADGSSTQQISRHTRCEGSYSLCVCVCVCVSGRAASHVERRTAAVKPSKWGGWKSEKEPRWRRAGRLWRHWGSTKPHWHTRLSHYRQGFITLIAVKHSKVSIQNLGRIYTLWASLKISLEMTAGQTLQKKKKRKKFLCVKSFSSWSLYLITL